LQELVHLYVLQVVYTKYMKELQMSRFKHGIMLMFP
jgi:hypothetical protein